MERAKNQVIVKDNGNSWLGTYVSNKKINEALNHILELSKEDRYKSGTYANAFWVLDMDGSCVAAQSSLIGAMRYYNENRILVHYQTFFV